MIRLRISIVFVISLLGLSACQQDDVLSHDYDAGDRILFSTPSLVVETRGTGELKDALTAGDEFGVLGYCIPYQVGSSSKLDYNGAASPWSTKRNYCPPSVFYKQKVTVGSSGCTYNRDGDVGNNPKSWYRDGLEMDGTSSNPSIMNADEYQYSFFAYYPYDEYWSVDAPLGASEAGAPKVTFTMPQVGGADLSATLDQSLTPDAMLSVLYNRMKGDGNLKFNFSHVLTGLRFMLNNYSERDLIIYAIKLQGHFFKKVTVDFANTVVAFSFPTDRYIGTYTLYENPDGLRLVAPSEGQAGTSSDDYLEEEYLMLISGEDSYFGENVQVVIDYKFGDAERKSQPISRPGTFTPVPGVKYTAQLNFVGDAFVLQFIVDNNEQWEDGEADDGAEDNDDVIFE